MVSSRSWHAFRLAERPIEVALVTASYLAGLAVEANYEGEPEILPPSEALWLFDRRSPASTLALRSFLRDKAGGLSLSLFQDRELEAFVRQQIAGGLLVAIQVPAEVKLPLRFVVPAETSSAPVPIRSAPPPPAEHGEESDYIAAGQVQALLDAAENGSPFCEECARAAALRGAS